MDCLEQLDDELKCKCKQIIKYIFPVMYSISALKFVCFMVTTKMLCTHKIDVFYSTILKFT